MKGADRNRPCPCGSGLKAKRCAMPGCARYVEPPPPRHAEAHGREVKRRAGHWKDGGAMLLRGESSHESLDGGATWVERWTRPVDDPDPPRSGMPPALAAALALAM